jgi:hypothetical protein
MSGGSQQTPVLAWNRTGNEGDSKAGTDVGRKRAWIAVVVGLLAGAAWPTAAMAGRDDSVINTTDSGVKILETDETRRSCTSPQLVQAFSSLADTRDYVLAPGGSFEDDRLQGWQVQKARINDEGSPLRVEETNPPPAPTRSHRHGDDDDDDDDEGDDDDDDDENEQSLKVPAGGSALSPAMCVDLHYPIFRFMAKRRKGTGLLKVEVVYPDSQDPVFHTVGSLTQGRKGWGATGDVPVYPERGGAAWGMRRVALRFTSVAGAGAPSEWRIDDIYVDPRRRI